MPQRRPDQSGASEIVGALMLILVVSVAATSMAAFVSQQQKHAQAQKALESRRASERLEISGVVPTLNLTAPDRWANLNFSVSSLHTGPSQLVTFALNDAHLVRANLTQFDRTLGAWRPMAWNGLDPVALNASERVFVNVSVNQDPSQPTTILTSDPIRVDVTTVYLNHVRRAFTPPSAVVLLDTKSIPLGGGAYQDVVILDGTRSDHPDPAATIVQWRWTVLNTTASTTSVLSGRVVRGFDCDGDSRDIALRVLDNFGLFSEDVVSSYVCGP